MLGVASLLLLGGCAARPATSQAPDWPIAPPARPTAPDLSTPEATVRSYLAWTAYAYRTGVSEVASSTMSDDESVRVDSYVELNKEQGRTIDQQLISIKFWAASHEGTHTVVPAHEVWRYRYLKPDGSAALSPVYTIRYDTTYTVVPDGGRFVVDRVDAKPLGAVK